jgi:mycothiol system anti-sigma-R factor
MGEMEHEVDCGPECVETRAEIERLVDDEIDAIVRVRVEQHLSGCHPCTERLDFRKHVKMLVHEKCRQDAVPTDLAERIRDAIREASGSG